MTLYEKLSLVLAAATLVSSIISILLNLYLTEKRTARGSQRLLLQKSNDSRGVTDATTHQPLLYVSIIDFGKEKVNRDLFLTEHLCCIEEALINSVQPS
ncbi:hypothetical protein [Selenomonas sp. oral taxon 149]|uniref:hypothetical protein n=1 Tax=Selenomonas sp. oral taxon 149 TaxID=712535 RepID=UPI00058691B6|nr:hypothetical protein [Selenomonas sp. oral taxon 149]